MIQHALAQSVERLAAQMVETTDQELERSWAWRSYDSEGIRLAFFRVYEELRQLSIRLSRQRRSPITSAQESLGLYHAAYRDMQAVLLGLPVELMEQAPAGGEWPVRRVVAHMLGADIGFYVVIRHALDQHRAGVPDPGKPEEKDWDRISGLDEASYTSLMKGPVEDLFAYHRELHYRVLSEFADITEDEMELGARYWEQEAMGLRFRLLRFDSHMRQHTIQLEKALAALGQAPNEARRLLRLIYAGLAAVEAAVIGEWDAGSTSQTQLAGVIDQWLQEIVS